MFFRAAKKGSAGIGLWKTPGTVRSGVLFATVSLIFLLSALPANAEETGTAVERKADMTDGGLMLAASSRYGTPLKFDAPPVDLPDESGQRVFPRAKVPGEESREVLEDDIYDVKTPPPVGGGRKPAPRQTVAPPRKGINIGGDAQKEDGAQRGGGNAGTGPKSAEDSQGNSPAQSEVAVPGSVDEPANPVGEPVDGALEKLPAGRTGGPKAAQTPAPQAGASGPGGQEAKKKGPIRLFGTVDFRGALKNLPKWQRVLNAEKKTSTFGTNEDKTMPAKVLKEWQALKAQIEGKELMEQAKAVNSFFNRWPYKTDQSLYGVTDYWATPTEFIKKSGDCEDYAITKYYALRSLGVPAKKMRVVALKDTIRNIGHAVLVIYTDDNAYVLDNLSQLILVHSRLKHYVPQYSVNEEFRWAHVVPLN